MSYWQKRNIFTVNTKEIIPLYNYEKTIICLNKGNRIYLNPSKPILYLNKIENPFVNKPILYITSMYKIETIMNKTNLIYIKNNLK